MNTIKTVVDFGTIPLVVEVERRLTNSLPTITIVGFAHRSVTEAKERLRGALASSGVRLPAKRIIINLSPAEVPKYGSAFDLPMAVAVLHNIGRIRHAPDPGTLIWGELSLDGSIKPVSGIIGKLLAGRKAGFQTFWIPEANLRHASMIPGIDVVTFATVQELLTKLNAATRPQVHTVQNSPTDEEAPSHDYLLEDIAGQSHAKRLLLIAAAGKHHLLMNGPPGVGKSLLAQALHSILPRLSVEDSQTATYLHSLNNGDSDTIVSWPPLRAPHHSTGRSTLLGSKHGRISPGELSLAHGGVILLDELSEFGSQSLEALRQPIENKQVTFLHHGISIKLPCDVQLVATSNPCPCGFYQTDQPCTCSAYTVRHYRSRLSGPILDRIDLYTDIRRQPNDQTITSHNVNETSAVYRRLVSEVRALQLSRSGKLNNELDASTLYRDGASSPDARNLLAQAADKLNLSPRATIRSLRVARTIADLEDSKLIQVQHISEALQYRRQAVVG